MTAVVLAIIRDAVAAGAAIGLYLWCVWPQLRMRRASHFAFAVTAAPAVAVPAALVAELYLELPVLLVPALLTLVLATWAASGLVVRASGGARALAPDVAAASTEIGRAWERIEVGDVEEAARIVNRLNVLRTQKTGQLIDLWRRYIDEELARRGGTRLSSRDTKEEIGAELGEAHSCRGSDRRQAGRCGSADRLTHRWITRGCTGRRVHCRRPPAPGDIHARAT